MAATILSYGALGILMVFDNRKQTGVWGFFFLVGFDVIALLWTSCAALIFKPV